MKICEKGTDKNLSQQSYDPDTDFLIFESKCGRNIKDSIRIPILFSEPDVDKAQLHFGQPGACGLVYPATEKQIQKYRECNNISEDVLDIKNCILFTTGLGGHYTSNGYKVTLDFDSPQVDLAGKKFGKGGKFGFIVHLTQQVYQNYRQQQTTVGYHADVKQLQHKSQYGHFAALLDKSHFWHHLQVLKAAGPERYYLAWCRQGPCAIDKHHQGVSDDWGHVHFQYDHTNNAKNSGMGFKNKDYYGWPLCFDCHQRCKGQQGAFADYDFVKKLVNQHQHKWARERVKKHLKSESWKDISPAVFCKWAHDHNLYELVPADYKTQCDALLNNKMFNE